MNPLLRNVLCSLSVLLSLSACTTAPELRDGRALTFNVEGRGLVKMEAINIMPFWLQGSEPFCLWDVKVEGLKNTEIYPRPGWRRNPVCASKKNKPDGPYELQTAGTPYPAYVVAELHIEFRRSADGEMERYSTTVPFEQYRAKGESLDSPQFVIDERAVRAIVRHFASNGALVDRKNLSVQPRKGN